MAHVPPTTAIVPAYATELMERAQEWADIVGAWLATVQDRTGSAPAPAEHGRYASHIAARLDGQGRTLADATTADLDAYDCAQLPDRRRGGALGQKPGVSAVNVRVAAIRSFYDFARRIGAVETNPAGDVKRPQLPQAAPGCMGVPPIHGAISSPSRRRYARHPSRGVP